VDVAGQKWEDGHPARIGHTPAVVPCFIVEPLDGYRSSRPLSLPPPVPSRPRIALFGGSFDPVHRGHLEVARRASDHFALDQVIFMPAATPPHKVGKELAPGSARLAMLECATAEDPTWEVSDVELRRAGTSFTVDTLRSLSQDRCTGEGGAELFMIIGSDNLPGLPGWREVEEVLTLAQPIIAWREGTPDGHLADLAGRLPESLIERLREGFMELPPLPESATEIRARIATGTLEGTELPATVLEVIEREGLYGIGSTEART